MNTPDPSISIGYWAAIVAQQYYTLMLHRLRKFDLDRGFYALLTIAQSEGRMSQQELAEVMRIEKVTMFRLIDMLSEKGYVERVICSDDRRKHHIKLLPKARPVVKQIRKVYEELNELAFKGIKVSDRRILVQHMNTMLENLALGELRPVPLKYRKITR